MAVRTADLPEPFSPDRKVNLWLGLNVKVYNMKVNHYKAEYIVSRLY